MRNPVFVYKKQRIKYTANCSCYYSCGEIVFWDEKKDEIFKTLKVVDSKEAEFVMNGWVLNAPKFIECKKLIV